MLEDKLSIYGYDAIKKLKLLNRNGSKSQKEKFLNYFKVISLLKEEIVSVQEWKSDLDSLKADLELVDSKLANWKKKINNLEKEKEDLYTEMLEELENNRKTSQHKNNLVREEIEEMRKYIRKLIIK